MERFLLDSSAIIESFGASRKGALIKQSIGNAELRTSIICYCEVLNKMDLVQRQEIEEEMSKFIILPISIEDGVKAKKMQLECRKKGKQVGTMDALIAASASNRDLILIATDSDFERIEGLKKQVF